MLVSPSCLIAGRVPVSDNFGGMWHLDNALSAMAAFKQGQTVSQLSACMGRQPALVRRLEKFSFPAVAAAVSGLLTYQENHPNTLRLEVLIHLAAVASICLERLMVGFQRNNLTRSS
jgi:hypothetical protein